MIFYRVKKDEFGLAVPVAFMGAPVVVIEKLCSGTESPLCLSAIQKILATGENSSLCNKLLIRCIKIYGCKLVMLYILTPALNHY